MRTFLRRTYLDVVGRQPTPAEYDGFLLDPSPEKRMTLVGRLLDDPNFLGHIKESMRSLVRAAEAGGDRGKARPVHHRQATLDRVDIGNGNLIDVHLDDGLDFPPTDRATAHARLDDRGVLMIQGPATRLQALKVAVDAPITVEAEGRCQKHLKGQRRARDAEAGDDSRPEGLGRGGLHAHRHRDQGPRDGLLGSPRLLPGPLRCKPDPPRP